MRTARARLLTWQKSDDGRIRVGPFVKVGRHLGGALAAVAAHAGPVSEVAAAVHGGGDLAVALLAGVHRRPEPDPRHWRGERSGAHAAVKRLKIVGVRAASKRLIRYTQLLREERCGAIKMEKRNSQKDKSFSKEPDFQT